MYKAEIPSAFSHFWLSKETVVSCEKVALLAKLVIGFEAVFLPFFKIYNVVFIF